LWIPLVQGRRVLRDQAYFCYLRREVLRKLVFGRFGYVVWLGGHSLRGQVPVWPGPGTMLVAVAERVNGTVRIRDSK